MADVYSNLPDGTLSDGWEVHTVNGKEVFRAELSTGGLTGRYALSKIIYDVDDIEKEMKRLKAEGGTCNF